MKKTILNIVMEIMLLNIQCVIGSLVSIPTVVRLVLFIEFTIK